MYSLPFPKTKIPSRKRSKKKEESIPEKKAFIFFYKDTHGNNFLCCNKKYPRYRVLQDEDVMRNLILDFCMKEAQGGWEGGYVKDELFPDGEKLSKNKTEVVFMIDCFVDKKVVEKFEKKDLKESYEAKDIQINSILLASYYGRTEDDGQENEKDQKQGIYINLVSSKKGSSAAPIIKYFLKTFFNEYYADNDEVLELGDDEEEEKEPSKVIQIGNKKKDFNDSYHKARKVLLDSVLTAVGYYKRMFNFQLRDKCGDREKKGKSNKYLDIDFYTKKRQEYQKILSVKPGTATTLNDKIKRLAFQNYEKDFFERLEIDGFKKVDSNLVRMKLCPKNKNPVVIYVKDDEEDYNKYLEKAKAELGGDEKKKSKSKKLPKSKKGKKSKK